MLELRRRLNEMPDYLRCSPVEPMSIYRLHQTRQTDQYVHLGW